MKFYQRLFAIRSKVYFKLFENSIGKKVKWNLNNSIQIGWIFDRFILFGRKYFVVFLEKEKIFIHLDLDSNHTVEKEKKFFREVASMREIIFERDTSQDDCIAKNGTYFDCYHEGNNIGMFIVYKNLSLLNVQEIYIEVNKKFRKKGFGKEIYLNFIDKANKLGFKNKTFYAAICNTNKKSIELCRSLNFEEIKSSKKLLLKEDATYFKFSSK